MSKPPPHLSRSTALPALGVVAALALALTACATAEPTTKSAAPTTRQTATTPAPDTTSASPTPAASTATPTKTPPPDVTQSGPRTVVITVRGRTVDPKPGSVKVKKGEDVLLVVTTEKASELHVHGVDVEKETKAGKPVQIPLSFDETGSFEVELHDPALLLTKFVVS